MKYVFILFLILTACGKEDSASVEKSCKGIIHSTCETDGSKCYDDCGVKVKLTACYEFYGSILIYPTQMSFVKDKSYCDVFLEKDDNHSYYIAEVFPPFKKETCIMSMQTPICQLPHK